MSLLPCPRPPGENRGVPCDVLRCDNPFQSGLNVGIAGSGPIDVRLCGEHQAQIDQGARWLYQWEDRCLLMGRDLPPRAVKAEAKEFLSPDGITRVFTFVVEDHEGGQRDYEFELPSEFRDGIKRILDRGRGGAGPA